MILFYNLLISPNHSFSRSMLVTLVQEVYYSRGPLLMTCYTL